MIPEFLKAEVEAGFSRHLKKEIKISASVPVSGGCINSCLRLETNAGKHFLKYNDASLYPGMFEAEASGLQLLKDAEFVAVPEVYFSGEINNVSFLVMEWVEQRKRVKNFWADFGNKLAALHRSTAEHFGLAMNNYIGSLAQSNAFEKNWVDFFIHQRIEPQLRMAKDAGKITDGTARSFEKLFHNLPGLIPVEKPVLLHGDLWNGNYLVNERGEATLVDPAVYYGHREMDLSMTKLFGGFDREFYPAYEEAFPLEKGFEGRVDIHNLYPLLVHVNLFGGGYMQNVTSILKKFS